MRNWILRLSGLGAIIVAGRHSYAGHGLLQKMALPEADMMLVNAFLQIGSVGWLVGGILLIAAASWTSQTARNWVVGVYGLMFGVFAVGNLVLNSGKPSFGWIALSLIVIFALIGRKADDRSA